MSNGSIFFRTVLVLGFVFISTESFAQRTIDPDEEDSLDQAYDPRIHDGGAGMACDDPSTVGEANRSPEEQACWDRYSREVEDGIRRQTEDNEERIREFDEMMRESVEADRRGPQLGRRGRGRRRGDW